MESRLEAKSLEQAALLFDCDHYRGQLDIFNDWSDEDLFAHYLTNGWRHGLDPHPCFSSNYYLLQVPDLKETESCPLVHYFQENPIEINPHPLFDGYYYLGELEKRRRSISGNPLYHYLTEGHKIANPHPLFDDQFYLNNYNRTSGIQGSAPVSNILPSTKPDLALSLLNGDSDSARYERAPLVHYLTVGHLQNCSPHPLFSIEYYREQGYNDAIDPLSHYLLGGFQKGLRPHPLASFDFIADLFENPDVAPLLEYLLRMVETVPPHPLFDYEFYRMQLDATGVNSKQPLALHYLSEGHLLRFTPSVLFDPVFYECQGFDPATASLDAFSDFLASGHAAGKHPHPFIDTTYLRQGSKSSAGAVVKTLEDISLDFKKYADREVAPSVKGSILADINIIEHWILRDCRSFMDALWTCVEEKVSSVLRHLDSGGSFARATTKKMPHAQFPRYQAIFYQVDTNMHGVAVVNLELAREIARRGVEIVFISSKSGKMDGLFKKVGRLYILEEVENHKTGSNLTAFLLQRTRPNLTFAILNGLAASCIAPYLRACKVPIVAWINETLDLSKETEALRLLKNADRIVYPSEHTRKTYRRMGARNGEIIPTAVMPFDRSTTVEEITNIPQGRKVVLTVGSVIPRKQPGLFLEFAKNLIQRGGDYHFVWVGDEKNAGGHLLRDFEYQHESVKGRISFVPQTGNIQPYYRIADVLVHTALNDPFPGSITEALAAGVPVVAFSDSIGSEEVFADKGATFVPRAATDAMASAVLNILEYPEKYAERVCEAQRILSSDLSLPAFANRFLRIAAEELEVPSIGTFEVNNRAPATPTKNIIFITSTWFISGVHQVMERLVNSLNERGWNAHVLLADPKDYTTHGIPDCPFAALNFYGKREKEARADYFMRYIEQFDSAILVMAFEHISSSLSSLVPERFGIVGMIQSDQDVYYETAYRLGRYWNHIVGVSNKIVENVNAMNPLFEDKSSYIFNSSILKSSYPATRKKRENPVMSLLYTGRFDPEQKNFKFFIPLVQELYQQGVDFKLTLVGGDEPLAELELRNSLQRALKEGRLEIHGRLSLEELACFYEAADIFMLPSRFEGFPLSLVEAMAHGCVPIVASIESGVPELVPNDSVGFVFEQDNYRDAAQLIQRLAKNSDLLFQMSQNAQEHIRKNFYAEKMVDQYEHVFEEVALELVNGYERPPDLSWQNRFGTRHFPFF